MSNFLVLGPRDIFSAVATPAPNPPSDPYRVAADAVAALAHCLRDCACEVEARGGQRVARGMLDSIRDAADRALDRLYYACPVGHPNERELSDMMDGCRLGYVREEWALRIVAMGAEQARKVEPKIPAHQDVPLCPSPGCRGPLVLREEHGRGAEYAARVRLVCLNCGDGFIGTDADVAKASKARDAWKAKADK